MGSTQIYCKIELAKHPKTNTLTLIAHLNPKAPNISISDHTISWEPTQEERAFLFDAFQMLQDQNHEQKHIVSFTTKPVSSKTQTKTIEEHDPYEQLTKTINETLEKQSQEKTDPHQHIERILQEKKHT